MNRDDRHAHLARGPDGPDIPEPRPDPPTPPGEIPGREIDMPPDPYPEIPATTPPAELTPARPPEIPQPGPRRSRMRPADGVVLRPERRAHDAPATKEAPLLIFRQLFDATSSTYTYLVADGETREAVLIDPVFEQFRRDRTLVTELGLTLRWTIETHVHADHVTGAALLRRALGSRIAIAERSGAEGADRYLREDSRVTFGKRWLDVRETPGHTSGCLTLVLDDRSMAFTGDLLLIRGTGRTDFQQGDAAAMYRSVRSVIFSLPDDCLLYPGHDYRGLTVSSVGEERRCNPRLGGDIGENDFVKSMASLKLPHPKQMEVAVPANLKCGAAASASADLADPQWAPLKFHFAGFWQIDPQTLAELGERVQIVDVREPDEFDGPLGHIRGARLIPLGTLDSRKGDLDRERPVVVVCRSGARSAQAVVNLAGGMLRWRAEGAAVEGGRHD